MNPLHEGLEVALHHAVVLDRLPRGEPDRAVTDLVAEVHRREQLVGRQLAAGHAGADHERDLANALGPLLRLPLLAVVLLVGAVVLEQLDARLAEAGGPVNEFLGDIAGQIVAGDLRQLDGGGFWRGGLGGVIGHGRFRPPVRNHERNGGGRRPRTPQDRRFDDAEPAGLQADSGPPLGF
jgi:hypothetical protein